MKYLKFFLASHLLCVFIVDANSHSEHSSSRSTSVRTEEEEPLNMGEPEYEYS